MIDEKIEKLVSKIVNDIEEYCINENKTFYIEYQNNYINIDLYDKEQ